MTAKEKLTKAEISLLLDEPFFGSLACKLELRQDDTINPPTMCTNGRFIKWHSDFVNRLEVDEIKTVLVHEVMHCAFLHHTRRGSRDPKKWNFATDYSINNELESLNEEARKASKAIPFPFPKGPKGENAALLNPAFIEDTEETIYDKLPDPKEDDKGGNGNEPGGMGEVEDGGGTPEEIKEQESDWTTSVIQAAMIAKKQGKLPGRFERLIEEMLFPPPRWQELLRNFIRDFCKDDFSWKRPNRRYLGSGFVLPSLYSEKIGPIAVAVDTSGSIDQPLLNEFMAELEGLCREVHPAKIILMDCDATLHSVREYGPEDQLPRDFKGGGGTSFVPPIEAMENEDICCLIYFTDLYGDFPPEPNFPTFWATKTDGKAPYGVTVKLD